MIEFGRLTIVCEISLADCGDWHSPMRFHWLTVEINTHQRDFIGWLWRLTLTCEISLVHWGDWHSPVTFHWLIHCWLSVSPPPGFWPPSTRGSPSGSWSADSWFCAASSYTSGDRSVLPHCRSLFHPQSLCRYFQFDHYQIDLKYIHRYMKWNSIEINTIFQSWIWFTLKICQQHEIILNQALFYSLSIKIILGYCKPTSICNNFISQVTSDKIICTYFILWSNLCLNSPANIRDVRVLVVAKNICNRNIFLHANKSWFTVTCFGFLKNPW